MDGDESQLTTNAPWPTPASAGIGLNAGGATAVAPHIQLNPVRNRYGITRTDFLRLLPTATSTRPNAGNGSVRGSWPIRGNGSIGGNGPIRGHGPTRGNGSISGSPYGGRHTDVVTDLTNDFVSQSADVDEFNQLIRIRPDEFDQPIRGHRAIRGHGPIRGSGSIRGNGPIRGNGSIRGNGPIRRNGPIRGHGSIRGNRPITGSSDGGRHADVSDVTNDFASQSADVDQFDQQQDDDGNSGFAADDAGQFVLAGMGKIEREDFNRRLIGMVRDHECLWNYHSNAYYEEAEDAETMWRNIADSFNIPGLRWTACKQAFKNLKDTFKRKLDTIPSGAGYDEGRQKALKWTYFGDLEFLTDTFEPRRTTTSWLGTGDQLDETDHFDDASVFSHASNARWSKKAKVTAVPVLPKQLTDSLTDACASMASSKDEMDIGDPNMKLGLLIASELSRFPLARQGKLRRSIQAAVNNVLQEEDEHDSHP